MSFLLTNKAGSYALFSAPPRSRYEGLFFYEQGFMFKAVEEFRHATPVDGLEFTGESAVRSRGRLKETFYFPQGKQALFYKLSERREFDLVLDCRHSYDTRRWGRSYTIEKGKDHILIKYEKLDDHREHNHQFHEYHFYLAICSADLAFQPVQAWLPRAYEYDKERESEPWNMWVFNAVRLRCADLAIGFGLDAKNALARAREVYVKKDRLLRADEKLSSKLVDGSAYGHALYALISLSVLDEGAFAGLPWFFQVWARDELISIGALAKVWSLDLVKKRLLAYARRTGASVRTHEQSSLLSADASGWLFHRVGQALDVSERFFSAAQKKMLVGKIEKVAGSLEFEKGLVRNGPLETWMDTHWQGQDKREGCRIEIQALTLSMIRTYARLKGESHPLEAKLKAAVRESLWNGTFLRDGLGDETARPNVFIAAYVYPDLLSKKEWVSCFDYVLDRIWLGWGGIASIDVSHPLFVDRHTGEGNQSYHRGDSWYWINNLAALVLHRVDKKKYKKKIDALYEASRKELLEGGVKGFSAELSDARARSSKGCLAQLWSSALFVELCDELGRHE